MTPFGRSVSWELRAAMARVETASIIDASYLPKTCEALVTNALFYVRRTRAIEAAWAEVFARAYDLTREIAALGVHPDGTSPAVDAARLRAVRAFRVLIAAVEDAQVTPVGFMLGVA